MLKIAQIDKLRAMFYEANYSVSQIAKNFKIFRTTVYKFIHCDDFTPRQRKRRSDTKMLPFIPLIDYWLQESIQAPKKQRFTAKRIFYRLKEERPDFMLSYDTVRKYVKKLKQKYKMPFNCYLPLVHAQGEAQADFFECAFKENGKQVEGYAFILSFPYSNAAFTQVFKGKTAECMLQGMKNIFEFIGVVPHTIWFDNDVAIVKINEDRKRNFCDFFLRFKNHYRFKTRFCNLRSPNEKGNVEANVRTLRNNLFVPLIDCDNIDSLNAQLLNRCSNYLNRPHYLKKKSISELFNEEIQSFISLPIKSFDVAVTKLRKVNKVGRIAVNNHYYFIGSQYAKQNVSVKITYKEIIIEDYIRSIEITRFPRVFSNNFQSQTDWSQYLPIIATKLKSLNNLAIMDSLPLNIKQILLSGNKEIMRKTILELDLNGLKNSY